MFRGPFLGGRVSALFRATPDEQMPLSVAKLDAAPDVLGLHVHRQSPPVVSAANPLLSAGVV